MISLPSLMSALNEAPEDIFNAQDHCLRPIFFRLESEEALLLETFSYVRDNHFLYATDIPHWDSEFPENLQKIHEREDLSDPTKNKLLYQNAKALYAI